MRSLQCKGDGDLLVTQTRSPIGHSRELRKVLKSLGLRKTGQVRIFDQEQPAIKGQLRLVDRFVRTESLALPMSIATSDSPDSKDMAQLGELWYEIGERPALRLSFSHREFVQVEVYEDFFALAWATALPFSAYLARTCDLMPKQAPSDEETGVLAMRGMGKHVVTSGRGALSRAAIEPSNVLFLRIDYPQLSVTWRTPSQRRGGAWEPGESGLIAESFESLRWARLIRRTATPEIASRALGVVDAFGLIIKV
ncbi:uL30 family ribosomal protein [Streptomyces sp. NPDC021096]|uniref:uL30 family ribosomal protein n=1 Tax=Streptomyces sp. NPDC021096 TaxID=3154792 RepID=UPI0033C83F97